MILEKEFPCFDKLSMNGKQEQHERKITNDFKLSSVRPERVEG